MVNRSMTSGGSVPRGDVRAQLRLVGAAPTLTDAPAALLRHLVGVGRVVHVPPRWTMLAEQTASDKAYVLLKGEVEVRRHGQQLGYCRPGEILGELGILHHRLRSATVVTATDVMALHLASDEFERLHAEDPYFRALVHEAELRKTA
ncbi:MAG: cyclic nucleotide-binding domain-containing protein [Propionibacteriales bacterium]|nr:cyclic nucleotide-binding domain-containing protein [Propionibacteriales bacterium]